MQQQQQNQQQQQHSLSQIFEFNQNKQFNKQNLGIDGHRQNTFYNQNPREHRNLQTEQSYIKNMKPNNFHMIEIDCQNEFEMIKIVNKAEVF